MTPRPWIENFSAGYMQRVMDQMPKQGDREPWTNPQRFELEKKIIGKQPVNDGVMTFSSASSKISVAAGE